MSALVKSRFPGNVRCWDEADAKTFHNVGYATSDCSSKAKMSALSKVQMSVSGHSGDVGGCGSDGFGADERKRAESD
jgi:hypothetical protein